MLNWGVRVFPVPLMLRWFMYIKAMKMQRFVSVVEWSAPGTELVIKVMNFSDLSLCQTLYTTL